ncbi:MAG: hypothetical protein G01um101429_655 [Parcubacteria group bacterium Gr01-1014_29]|nr:MAG: hypothetical protein G01um101429_655 [Parcubacteria group bacterium Gr01-1014_29]
MKKIIISGSLIVAVAALMTGATMAFFNDTETSAGNVLTAGSIDLRVDSFGATRNGVSVQESSWFPAVDLTKEKFFNFGDVKPGDYFGRNLSLHVDSNPAWVCLLARNVEDDGNGLTDPEQEANDPSDGNGEGEVAENLHMLAWLDSDANGTHQLNEPFLVDSFFDVFTELAMPIHDSTTGAPLDPSIPIELLQMDLCGGAHIVNPNTGAVSCNGNNMGNKAQGDSLKADLVLYAEQYRNNPNFKCADVALNPQL